MTSENELEQGRCEEACAVGVDDLEAASDLCDFIERCPSMFHTAATVAEELEEAGFERLAEGAAWKVERGGRYFVQRNASSTIAFAVGADVAEAGGVQTSGAPYRFQLTASHGDSPTFKVKAVPELEGPGEYLRLDTEAYGGMIDYTWFDRPLTLAGRVLVREGARIESRLFCPDRDLALIPSLAIHMDRSVNKGFAPNRATDLCPLFSAGALGAGAFDAMVADELGVEPEQIVGRDLFLATRQEPCIWGQANEFVSAPRLDDLACAYTALRAFVASENPACVAVYCCFDNEEVGSNTKQGAMSTFLPDTLRRINAALGYADEDYLRALAASMLVSCDNAHALHPAHPEAYDGVNRVALNGGIVIKEAANQAYCTDAFSRAAFLAICADAGVPVQMFANRSDKAGGSTLGNLSNIQASMHAVDVGLPQLAMHSSYETAGTRDVAYATRALRAFYEADLRICGAESIELG